MTTPEPDKNLTPGQVPDPLAVYLAAAGERWDAAGNGTWEDYPTALELLSSALRSAADVPRLLGALEAVRAVHRRDHHRWPSCEGCGMAWPCQTHAAITAELLREVPADER